MCMRLLVTVRGPDVVRTFSFDETTQSILWIGLALPVDPAHALAHVQAEQEGAVIRPAAHTTLVVPSGSATLTDAVRVRRGQSLLLGLRCAKAGITASVFVRPAVSAGATYGRVCLSHDAQWTIGRDKDTGFWYANRLVSGRHARMAYDAGAFVVEDLGSGNGTFVNGMALPPHQPRWLVPGDVVQVVDLTLMAGGGFLLVNRPDGFRIQASISSILASKTLAMRCTEEGANEETELPTFYPAPRLSRSVQPLVLSVDDPPARSETDGPSALMQLAPSFLMSMASVFMFANGMSGIAAGGSVLQALPSLSMAVAMVAGCLIMPAASRSLERRRQIAKEAQRARLYVSYLDSIETRLAEEAKNQTKVLEERHRPVDELLQRAEQLSPLLMSHAVTHDDFLQLRVGVGDMPLMAEIAWPQRRFSLVSDPLLERVERLANDPPSLKDVPLSFDMARHFVSGVVGDHGVVWEFLRGLMVQICALYSYHEVKIVLMAHRQDNREWESLTSLWHFHDVLCGHRHVVLSVEGLAREDNMLVHELSERQRHQKKVPGDYGVYYVVVCANEALARRSEAVRALLALRENKGFSVVFAGSELHDLPRECAYIVDLSSGAGALEDVHAQKYRGEHMPSRGACMFERADVRKTLLRFSPDILVPREGARSFALGMARARLDDASRRLSMPDSLGFLELFWVGNVAHLNVGQRWAEHDASRSLMAPVGTDAHGEVAGINLHEDAQGPHALIAGTTGSGKSEFIVTYVLSLAVNYAPDEVAFVLIDYKGGGLAGAFCNEHHRLPHLAGVITNLDGSAIKRALVSLQSELLRRQALLAQARDATGEATMDIHKYLSLYREGMVGEPLPHLFVIADEFAELKQQEPEFMDELVSAARIGRSLGVHLVLATQKPSGVVDDQIWSNARLKVSLKVSDVSDSREMIGKDDAADLTRPGQFLMLVGHNECFVEGQAAYAGSSYVPQDDYEPRKDTSVELIDAEGTVLASLRPPSPASVRQESETNAVLAQIEGVARSAGKCARPLWLEPVPPMVTLADMEKRYQTMGLEGLTCVVGEIDDPARQRQDLYALDLIQAGNVLLYGTQASDVEGLMCAMLLSLAKAYGSDELWMYLLDLGDGTLATLGVLPHVGGMALSDDDERIRNLFGMLEDEMRSRRGAFAARGVLGDPCDEREGCRPPRMVVSIANIGVLGELYPDLEERLVAMTRDAPRYGIHIMATAAAVNDVRLRLRSNFGAQVPTMLNDPSDYLSIVGSLGGVVPPHLPRRGLVRVGEALLEFQGVSIARTPNEASAVVAGVEAASRRRGGACPRPIPQLPERVIASHVVPLVGPTRFPVGFAKRGADPLALEVSAARPLLVLGSDTDALGAYLRGVAETLACTRGLSWRLLDMHKVLGIEGGTSVLTRQEEVESLARDLHDGVCDVDVVVLCGVVRIISSLQDAASQSLRSFLATMTNERTAGPALVLVSEEWRLKSTYEPWQKAVTASGDGIWVGNGFGDQSILRHSQPLTEFRRPTRQTDGFVCRRGIVTAVRLVQPTEGADDARERW